MNEQQKAIHPISVFCSYAPEDETFCDKLEQHLSSLLRDGVITVWHHRKILAGVDRVSVIDTQLMAASVIILLISPGFLASDYFYGVETKQALKRHANGDARVIPLIVRHSDWRRTPLGDLQCLPRNGEPVATWGDQDQAFEEIATGIRNVIEEIHSSPKAPQLSLSFPNTTSLAHEVETIQSKRYRLHKALDNIRRMREEAVKGEVSLLVKIEQEEKYFALLNQNIQTELRTVFSPLPRQAYARFVGRKEKLTEIRQVLEKQEAAPIVAIDGIGGAGKTALARELSQQTLKANTFYTVIWESDKPVEFTGGNLQQQSKEDFGFESLLDRISRKMGYFDVASMRTTKEKRDFVHRVLNSERYLVVIDNLETIKEYRDLINNLHGMFDRSKAIITTRKRIAEFQDVYSISLGGMPSAESIEFLRSEAAEQGEMGRIILSASESLLEKIHMATGGLPLAMRLVLGQTTRSSLPTVLRRLETVNYQKIQNLESDDDVYNQFFKFIYLDSWKQLSDKGKQLLIELGAFDPTGGARQDFLAEMSILGTQDLDEATEELVEFSLVRRSWSEDQETLYLHPLTHRFIQDDVEEVS